MSVDDDWCAIDIESKLNKKIDALQTVVQQQHELLQQMASSIQTLKEELHRTHQTASHDLSQRHDRTHELLEELKIMKHRELNMALREKVAVPFCSEKHLGYGTRTTPTLLSPYFLGRRMSPSSDASPIRSPTPFSL